MFLLVGSDCNFTVSLSLLLLSRQFFCVRLILHLITIIFLLVQNINHIYIFLSSAFRLRNQSALSVSLSPLFLVPVCYVRLVLILSALFLTLINIISILLVFCRVLLEQGMDLILWGWVRCLNLCRGRLSYCSYTCTSLVQILK